MRVLEKALTFDDVLLVHAPEYARVVALARNPDRPAQGTLQWRAADFDHLARVLAHGGLEEGLLGLVHRLLLRLLVRCLGVDGRQREGEEKEDEESSQLPHAVSIGPRGAAILAPWPTKSSGSRGCPWRSP